jgi:anti-sigma B factor antagonist
LPLTFDARAVGDVTIIRCGGRIVAGSETDSLREHITTTLQERRDIVLHLGDVVFIDSSGLGMLVRLLTTTRRIGGDLKLCQVSDDVLKILKITNLTKLFDVHESEQSAISSVYKRQTVSEQAAGKGPTVMCVDQSADVLACLRHVLRSTGYNILTNSNLHDSLILIRATRPSLLILGPNPGGSPATQRAFREACATIPVVELGDQFSTQDAGEAASELLGKIGSCMHPRGLSS